LHRDHRVFRNAFRGDDVVLKELSDAMLVGYSTLIGDLLGEDSGELGFELPPQRQVIVVTPDKLLYVLRHSPELADAIGLVVYDEGHQFDTGQRGVEASSESLIASRGSIENLLALLWPFVSSTIDDTFGRYLLSSAILPVLHPWIRGESFELIMGICRPTTERKTSRSFVRTRLVTKVR
jgi:hypothetical protein